MGEKNGRGKRERKDVEVQRKWRYFVGKMWMFDLINILSIILTIMMHL